MAWSGSFGAELRRLRRDAGLSQSRLGRLISYHPSHISKIENGVELPSPAFVEACDQALSAGGALLALAPSSPAAPSGDPTATVELTRRLRLSDVDQETIEALSTTTGRLCEEYAYRPAAQLRQEASSWMRYTCCLLDKRVGLRQHRELLVSAGWLALLVGCLEYDSGRSATAESTRISALSLGREAGHAEIVAWALEMAAWFAQTTHDQPKSLQHARAGQEVASHSGVTVQLLAHEARAHARMGDLRGVHDALDRGHALLQALDRPSRPRHHFVVDPDKFDFYAMDCYRLVGDNARAGAHAVEVLRKGRGPSGEDLAPMRMAEARVVLGAVAARSGSMEEAVHQGTRAFRGNRRCLPSLLLVAGELDQELQERYPNEQQTRNFHDQICQLRNVAHAQRVGGQGHV